MNWGQIKHYVKNAFRRRKDFLSEPALRKDDIFLVSYPRSGNTWVRVIIANILNGRHTIASLRELDILVPDIHKKIPSRGYLQPRVIKTHRSYPFRHERQNHKLYRRNIYIIRNPFDVIKSYYSYLQSLRDIKEDDYDRFARNLVNGMIGPCSWNEHVLSWYSAAQYNDTMFVRYEDLRQNTSHEIGRIAQFLGKEMSHNEIETVKENSSLEEMKRMEKAGSPVQASYEFIRSGVERDISKSLNEKTVLLVKERSKAAIELFGYFS